MSFEIKDSGERKEFSGGMVRDTAAGKIDYLSCRFGPMFKRWNQHLTKGREKYPDVEVGVPNWTLAEGLEERNRALQSAARHFEAYLAGEDDEDHAAGVFFNINLAEYVLDKMKKRGSFAEQTGADPGVFTQETVDQFDLAQLHKQGATTGRPFLDVLKEELDSVRATPKTQSQIINPRVYDIGYRPEGEAYPNRTVRGAGTIIGNPAEDPKTSYPAAFPDSPAKVERTPDEQLRQREYKDRMARERAILNTKLPPPRPEVLPTNAQTAP